MTKKELKELLKICTKNVHFTFDGKNFVQSDGVAMGSPSGPVLADISTVEVENMLVPTLTEYLKLWKWYVDDTIWFVKMVSVVYIVSNLTSFDANIQFTYKMEKKCHLKFLNILLTSNWNNIVTTVLFAFKLECVHTN